MLTLRVNLSACSHETVRVDSAGTRPQSHRSSSGLTAEFNEARYLLYLVICYYQAVNVISI